MSYHNKIYPYLFKNRKIIISRISIIYIPFFPDSIHK